MDAKAMKAKTWRGHCLVCDRDFSFAEGFECSAQPGRHTVEPKTYYHLGAGHIQPTRARRQFTPTLNLQGGVEVRDKVTGEITRTETIIVHFAESGLYETRDPLEQYHLDLHHAVMSGNEGREAWEKMYLTNEQQLSKAQGQLADVQRQVREQNALLDLAKSRKGQAA
jgi:hypothetical protein